MKKLCIFLILLISVFCRHPVVYEISTRPWLYELSKLYGKNITKLRQIPLEEFDELANNGVDIVWMMGVWSLGDYGLEFDKKQIKEYSNHLPDITEDDIIGSPFAITKYECNPEIGTDEDLIWLRRELNIRGMKLMLDFVPNHSAADHEQTETNPNMYFKEHDEVFHDETRYNEKGFAYGSDRSLKPWKDVIQYNYWEPKTVEVMKNNLKKVLTLADAVRCDRAYLILNDVFRVSWEHELIILNYTKPEKEFWTYAINEAKKINPNALFLGESYDEDYYQKLIDVGFDYIYNRALLANLISGATEVKAYLKTKDSSFMKTSCNFVENHDELRIAFMAGGNLEKAKAMGTIAATVGGMIFMNNGQLGGKTKKLDVHLRRATYEGDTAHMKNHYNKLNRVLLETAFRGDNFYYVDNITGEKKDDFIAYIREDENNHFLIVVNYSNEKGCANVPIYKIKGFKYALIFDALNNIEYVKNHNDVKEGMRICLDAWESHIYQYNY